MKKTIIVSMAAIVLLLVIFNGRQLYLMATSSALLNDHNGLIRDRGQQLLALQAFSASVTTGESALSAAATELRRSLFFAHQLELSDRAMPPQWSERQNYRLQLDRLSQLQAEWQTLIDAAAGTSALVGWSHRAMNSVNSLSFLEGRASDMVTRAIAGRYKTAVLVDVIGLLLLLLLVASLVVALRNDVQQKLITKLSGSELKVREGELLEHQQLMTSLLEDMKQERNRALELAYHLEQKNEEMEQFVYTVSHDLKTPLVTISGFAQKLEMEIPADDKTKHWFQRIHTNLSNMEGLLKDLLQLSQVVTIEVDKEWLDVSEVVEDVVNNFAPEVALDGQTIRFIEPLAKIHANKRLLIQVLQNLISNSLKYRSDQRQLEITISSQGKDGFIELAVSDNGIGIDQKYHHRVFKLFERLEGGEGTGVGLSIVKAIMAKHGGEVSLESVLGEGTVFLLTFPVVDSSVAETKRQASHL